MVRENQMNFGAFAGNADGHLTLPDAIAASSVTLSASPGLTFSQAASRIVPGATSLSLRNTANSADNVLVSDAGAVTIRAGLTVTASGVIITDGGLAVRGSARIREALTLSNIATAGAGTYTAAQLVGGLITRDPTGASRTDTMDTGTNIETELNAQGITVATGDTFICYVINTADAAEVITLAGDTGSTISNAGQTVAQNESAILIFQRTGANAYTFYVLGA